MKYSAAMTHKVFAYIESKKMAEMIVAGKSKEEIFVEGEEEFLDVLLEMTEQKKEEEKTTETLEDYFEED